MESRIKFLYNLEKAKREVRISEWRTWVANLKSVRSFKELEEELQVDIVNIQTYKDVELFISLLGNFYPGRSSILEEELQAALIQEAAKGENVQEKAQIVDRISNLDFDRG